MKRSILPALGALALAAPPALSQEAAATPPSPALPVPQSGGEKIAHEAARHAQENLRRIRELDDGPQGVNAVIALNPNLLRDIHAAARAGLDLGGRTILVKDNIETRELPTTAGSLALAGNATGRDAPLIARLRGAGGVVMGKANLSEWANIRDANSTSGWSAIGGLTRNPHALDRNACGSSSGSGAAVAAGFAWAAIGTETDGSITCPASVNGVVGFKPTVGLVSRTHIVPISHSQDTAGPMARTVRDAALLLQAIAGSDPADPATAEADVRKSDFAAGLANTSLEGVRVGVLRSRIGQRADLRALFETALADMAGAGAELVDVDFQPESEMYAAELTVLLFELRAGMDAYLASLPGEGMPRSLAELVAFNRANATAEMRWFGQSLFEQALETTDEAAYRAARATSLRLAGAEGIDRLLRDYRVDVLIAPTTGPAWTTDLVNGDHFGGGIGAGTLAAIAGYPHLTVPMGAIERLPVGISFLGGRWDDARILRIGAAFEAVRSAPVPEPEFAPWSAE